MIGDIVENSNEELNLLLTDAFTLYEKSGGEVSLDYVRESAGLNTQFYLTQDGIAFYYSVYEAASYAGGYPEVVIPYESLNLKIDIHSPVSEERQPSAKEKEA